MKPVFKSKREKAIYYKKLHPNKRGRTALESKMLNWPTWKNGNPYKQGDVSNAIGYKD